MTLAVLAVFFISTLSFAGWGGGYGHMAEQGMMGQGMMGPGWQGGNGYYGNLSADQIAGLNRERDEFLKATEGLRQQLYEKELALQSELAKEKPDTANASRLQSEISGLRSDLDQKLLAYDIQVRKVEPGYAFGHRGTGHMMGYGSYGDGYCMW